MESRDRSTEDDLTRVSREIASRITALGISLAGDEPPEQLQSIVEAVEEFERAVESRGGDLMVDEPPLGGRAQPDDPDFVLPLRAADETVDHYVDRLTRAAARIRRGPRK